MLRWSKYSRHSHAPRLQTFLVLYFIGRGPIASAKDRVSRVSEILIDNMINTLTFQIFSLQFVGQGPIILAKVNASWFLDSTLFSNCKIHLRLIYDESCSVNMTRYSRHKHTTLRLQTCHIFSVMFYWMRSHQIGQGQCLVVLNDIDR